MSKKKAIGATLLIGGIVLFATLPFLALIGAEKKKEPLSYEPQEPQPRLPEHTFYVPPAVLADGKPLWSH
jgi:hypothetical protein